MGFLGSIFGFLGGLGGMLISFGLGILNSLISGTPSIHGAKLKNKAISSSAYGQAWPRCRGTTRLPGNMIWSTKIIETTHKSTSGGIFGIGQQSSYYYTYSVSCAIGFGKKLGGGPAKGYLRIWADGKILWGAKVTNAALTGTVILAGPQTAGDITVGISVDSGGTLKLATGTLISFAGEPNTTYEVQTPVDITGPATVNVQIWPPLDQDFGGGGPITIAGLGAEFYDHSSFNPDPGDGSHIIGGVTKSGGIKFHLGEDDQQPDPIIVNWLGLDNTPGYRGLVYAVIYRLQLQNYGNRIPNFSAEITWEEATELYPIVGPVITGSYPADEAVESLGLAGEYQPLGKGLGILPFVVAAKYEPNPTPGARLQRVNTLTNTLEQVGDYTDQVWSDLCIDNDGYIYFTTPIALNTYAVYKTDLFTLEKVSESKSRPGQPAVGGPPGMLYIWDQEIAGPNGSPMLMKMAISTNMYGGATIHDRACAWGGIGGFPVNEIFAIIPPIVPIRAIGTPWSVGHSPMAVTDGNGDLWIAGGSTPTLAKYDGQFGPWIPDLVTGTPLPTYPSYSGVASWDLSLSGFNNYVQQLAYDPDSDSILILGSTKVGMWNVKTNVLIVISVIGTGDNILGSSIGIDGTVLVGGSTGFYRLDLGLAALGEAPLVKHYNVPDWNAVWSGNGGAVYDSLTNSVWVTQGYGHGNQLFRIYLDRLAGTGVTLDLVIAALHAEAGYDASQYDVTALSDIFVGGVEFAQEAYKQSIQNLLALYLVDEVETDGIIKYVPRGASAVITIPEDELGAIADGVSSSNPEPRLTEVLQDEQEVPERVSVQYYDQDKQYQQAVQYDKRISKAYTSDLIDGRSVTNSRHQLTISAEVSDTAGPMKRQAQKILYDAWLGRMQYAGKTTIKHIRLNPTDVVNLAYKSGTLEARLTEVDRGAGMALDLKGISSQATAAIYQSSATTSSGSAAPPNAGGGNITPPAPAVTQLIVLDTPYLSDAEADPTSSGLYYAEGALTWPWTQAVILRSTNGVDFAGVSNGAGPVFFGVVRTPPADPAAPWTFDTSTSFTVKKLDKSAIVPTSSTDSGITDDHKNLCALLKADGTIELLQFVNAIDNGDGTYTFDRLVRGVRGTETMAMDHAVGEVFVLLDGSQGHLSVPLSDRGITTYYEVAPISRIAQLQTQARDLMPYAPYQIGGSIDANDNIIITWARRTRVGGNWVDGTGSPPPLSEFSEAYEIDIMSSSSPTATVKRTLKSTVPTAVYLAADQVTDFGSHRTSITVRIYQMSAVVGRGFPGIGTVPASNGITPIYLSEGDYVNDN